VRANIETQLDAYLKQKRQAEPAIAAAETQLTA